MEQKRTTADEILDWLIRNHEATERLRDSVSGLAAALERHGSALESHARALAANQAAPVDEPEVADAWQERLRAWLGTDEARTLCRNGALDVSACCRHAGIEENNGAYRHVGRIVREAGLTRAMVRGRSVYVRVAGG